MERSDHQEAVPISAANITVRGYGRTENKYYEINIFSESSPCLSQINDIENF